MSQRLRSYWIGVAALAGLAAVVLVSPPALAQQGTVDVAAERELRSFPGLAHRQELLAVIEDVSYVNDSKATNPEAAARALACYQTVYWIAGGRSKDGGFDELTPFLPRIAAAYLIGEAEEALAEALSGKLRIERCGTLDKALELADRDARSFAKESPDARGPVVLLSPACASFDQYSDFEARGEAFRELVHALPDAPCNAAGGVL